MPTAAATAAPMRSLSDPAPADRPRTLSRVQALASGGHGGPLTALDRHCERRAIHNPYNNPDGTLTLPSLLAADGTQAYLPLDLIQLSPHHDLLLLPMLQLAAVEESTVWFLDGDLQFIEQVSASALDIATLYRLAQARPQASAWLTELPTATRHVFLEALRLLNRLCLEAEQQRDRQGMEIGPIDPPPEASGFFNTLVARLVPEQPLEQLLHQLREDPESLPGCDAALLLAMWEFACPRALFPPGCCDYSAALTMDARYALLKELHLLQCGRDLVFNPFSGRHQPGGLASFVPTDFSISTSFSVNKAVLFQYGDVELSELRGPGFSMMVTGYQIGGRRFVQAAATPTAWMPADYGRFVVHSCRYIRRARQQAAAAAESGGTETNTLNLLNLSLGTNLGHSFWNDISGYYLVRDLLEAFPQLQTNVRISSYQDGGTSFSSQCYNEFFQPHLEKELGQFGLAIVDDFQAVADLPRPMMLNGLIAPASLAERLRDHFAALVEPGRDPQQLRVLLNLRAHNKSLLNLADCLEAWLSTPEVQPLHQRLHFCLELHNTATEMAGQTSEVLSRHGIAHSSLIDCTLDDLCQEIALAKVVIAPVGSALVLPTWVWNRDCVAHGDPLHMRQLSMWPNVAPYFPDLREHLHVIPDEAIAPEGEQLYANYRVDPACFASQLQAAFARALAE